MNGHYVKGERKTMNNVNVLPLHKRKETKVLEKTAPWLRTPLSNTWALDLSTSFAEVNVLLASGSSYFLMN